MDLTVKALIYGQEYTLVYNELTGNYEAEVTAPGDSSYQHNEDHYFPVIITATDEAGNSTTISDTQGDFKDVLKLFVKEQIKPKIVELSPSDGSYISTSNPTISFRVLDNINGQTSGYSGINPDSIVLTVAGNVVDNEDITKTPIDGGYECAYIPFDAIEDGVCSVSVKAFDYDGNESNLAEAIFTIDTVPPVLEVTSPEEGVVTNKSTITVSGKTSDASSSPVAVQILINDEDQGEVMVESDGSFSKEITLPDKGTHIITVISVDSAGRESYVTRTVTLKTTAPKFEFVGISPNPVNCGKTYTISVTLVED